MNLIFKYSTFSKWFYLAVLGLTILFYLVLYGASGHRFNLPTEDIVWIFIISTAFLSLVLYLSHKTKSGLVFNFLRVLVAVTVLLTAYGALRVFIFIMQFNFGSDIDFLIRGLFFIIPLLFIFSAFIIFAQLFFKLAS